MPPKRVVSKVTKPGKRGRPSQKKPKPALNPFPAQKTQPLDIFVWGTGSMCELGLGPEARTKEVKRPRLNPFLTSGIVDLAVGGMHTLVLDKNNQVWSWGANDSYVLGRDTQGKETLRDINGEDDDEDGDLNEAESTPGVVENLPKDEGKVIQLAATDNLSAILYESGNVYAWGMFRCNEGTLGFSPDAKIQKTPKKILELKSIVQLAAGKDHILALNAYGKVFGWGDGQQYQLGRKIMERTRLQTLKPLPVEPLKQIKYIACGDYHSFAINDKGDVFTWGLNQYGQCGIKEQLVDGDIVTKPTKVTRLSNIVEIAGGEHHTLALNSSGKIFSFGRNDMFETGIAKNDLPEYSFKDSHGNIRAVPFPTELKKVPKFRKVAAGSHHSLAIDEDGVGYSWGYGDTYAVGQGPNGDDIEIPTRIKNTATANHNIILIGAGGQFSVSGGVKLSDEEAEKREDKVEEFEDSLEKSEESKKV